MDEILFPFQLVFMQQAFIITVVVAIPMAMLSCYLVLQGWSLMGDAISHAVFPGVVLAYIIGFPIIIGAFIAGMTCALLAGYVTENSRIKEDTALGIVFAGMFGIGLVLYVAIPTDVHLDHILFGDMLGVSWADIGQTILIDLVVVAFILAKRKDLLVSAFDPQHARAISLPVKFLHYALLAAISLAVVAALKSVGIILAIAFLVTPGAIALLITRIFSSMMMVSVGVAVASSIIGIYLSFFVDSAPGPTIVLVMMAFFIAAFIYAVRKASIAEATPQLTSSHTKPSA